MIKIYLKGRIPLTKLKGTAQQENENRKKV